VAVVADTNNAASRDALFNWSFINNTGQGCALMAQGRLDLNAYGVSYGAPAPAANSVRLHVLSLPENPTLATAHYTQDGQGYLPTSAVTNNVVTPTYSGCSIGFGMGQYLVGRIYAFALWDGYLTPEEAATITPELLLAA
jgi:hypothetical protein